MRRWMLEGATPRGRKQRAVPRESSKVHVEMLEGVELTNEVEEGIARGHEPRRELQRIATRGSRPGDEEVEELP